MAYGTSFGKRNDAGSSPAMLTMKDREKQKENARKWYLKNKDLCKKRTIISREEMKNKNREFVIKEKDKPCMDCGKKYPSYVTEYDH